MEVRCLLVFLVICSVECKKTYRVGVFENDIKIMKIQQYEDMIKQSASENLDILVLPPPELSISNGLAEQSDFSPQNYEKNINTISKITKESSTYVAVHLLTEIDEEIVKVNVVFDRNGTVIATYMKPQITVTSEIGVFTSSFGVLFGILQEEDIFLHNVGAFKNLKNFIVLGASDRSFKAANLASFFAHVTKANYITSNQIFGSANVRSNSAYKLVVVDLYKNGAGFPNIHPSSLHLQESCSIKPLDVEASIQGYEDTVCHETFCCGFYVKSHFGSSNNKISYALAALDDVQSYGDNYLKVENCAVLAYTGLYEYAVDFRSSQNLSAIKFDTIVISHNKTSITTYSVINTEITSRQFHFTAESNIVTTTVTSNTNISDSELTPNSTEEYITVEKFSEFFDYIWIKVRIILFVVSIYILEMM